MEELMEFLPGKNCPSVYPKSTMLRKAVVKARQ